MLSTVLKQPSTELDERHYPPLAAIAALYEAISAGRCTYKYGQVGAFVSF